MVHNVSLQCVINFSLTRHMSARGRTVDRRRNFDSLCAILFRFPSPLCMYVYSVIKVARLKLKRSAVISRRLQRLHFYSVAENDHFKWLGAHRIKNNVGLTPRVTDFSETSFISGNLPPRYRVYALGRVTKYFSDDFTRNIPILFKIESYYTKMRLICFALLKLFIHIMCDRCVKETLCLLDYHCSDYHGYALILLPHFTRSIFLKMSSATSAIFYFIMYELTEPRADKC